MNITKENLIPALEGKLNNCKCNAYSWSECGGCGAIWPESVIDEAIKEIEELRAEVKRLTPTLDKQEE